MLRPLTKVRGDGRPYERHPATTALLQELLALDRESILRRLAITDFRDPGHVPSECLVYLMREAARDNRGEWFNRLLGILHCRLKHNLAHSIRPGAVADPETVREEVISRFFEILARGLRNEPERLDPFEVMFNGALEALRKDLYGAQRRRDRRKADLRPDGEDSDGRPSPGEDPYRQPETENGLGMTTAEFEVFRKQALHSINLLPTEEREAITLLLQGHKIDSKDPDEMTIAKLCAVNERTVRNRIKRGVEMIRARLEGPRP